MHCGQCQTDGYILLGRISSGSYAAGLINKYLFLVTDLSCQIINIFISLMIY